MKRSERKRRKAARAAAQTPANASRAPSRKSRAITIAACLFLAALFVLGGYYAAKAFAARSAKPAVPHVVEGDGVSGPEGMMWVPGGGFQMGSDHQLAKPNERPAHPVTVSGFWMYRTHVTNAQFAAFVKATGYVTTAER